MTNLEIIKKSYDAGKNGDIPGLVADMAPDGKWTEMAGAPYAGTYTGGPEIIEKVFSRMGAEWAPFACEPVEFIDAGDTIVMLGYYFGTHGTTKKDFRVRVAHVWRLKDGKIVNFEQFTDTKLIAEAMK